MSKKRVEVRLEEDLVCRIDRVAGLLGKTRTDIIKFACLESLESIRTSRKSLKALA
ncbi:ribbon-helix-helix protein, CopG family [Candidatus Bathyarchaeota archaeon]|nr:ribbon-helix-helix protein, CopG family [Candidatus Bathyarchaeota archaeon]